MAQYQNILFDLGGVFIEIDYGKTRDAFTNLGVADFDALYAQHHASPLFEQLETGQISSTDFYGQFREAARLPGASDEQLMDAWCAMLGYFPPERIAWLKEIKQHYRVFLFSNTNAIHHQAFTKIFRQTVPQGPSFDEHFERVFYSHECGFRKPYPESYTRLLNEVGIKAAETLFIDDTAVNIEGARQAGLHTHLLLHPETVPDLSL